jgi:hypothetical protein
MKKIMMLLLGVALLCGCSRPLAPQQSEPSAILPVSQVLPKLAAADMQSKMPHHYNLAGRGRQVVPEMEAAVPAADKNTQQSIMWILSQIGRENPDLVPRFLAHVTVDQDPIIAGLYLDVVQDIVQPKGSRESYYFSATQGSLNGETIRKSRAYWASAYEERIVRKTDNKAIDSDKK